LKGPA